MIWHLLDSGKFQMLHSFYMSGHVYALHDDLEMQLMRGLSVWVCQGMVTEGAEAYLRHRMLSAKACSVNHVLSVVQRMRFDVFSLKGSKVVSLCAICNFKTAFVQ